MKGEREKWQEEGRGSERGRKKEGERGRRKSVNRLSYHSPKKCFKRKYAPSLSPSLCMHPECCQVSSKVIMSGGNRQVMVSGEYASSSFRHHGRKALKYIRHSSASTIALPMSWCTCWNAWA